MDSFIYSINATVPIFLVMIVGWVIKQLGVIDEHFVSKANKCVSCSAAGAVIPADFKCRHDIAV